ncbi:hypothetical protein [Pseudarthrobacter sp. H2]|uniref:hypothetical protein n=1 Tax=Pseudarthrobacter sp. H2 TaxID=3418415 RepID=UPI003CEF3101
MPFYLEYTANQHAEIRSAVDGSDLQEALVRAVGAVREAGCRTALLRFSLEPSRTFGGGGVVAGYTETAGWEIPERA